MRFDLIDLTLVRNIERTGTFTGGAEASCMTLASASQRIRNLEHLIGAPVFVRGKKGATPTAVGELVLQSARKILREVESLQGELGNIGLGAQARIQLLCNTSAISEHLPSAIGAFLRAHPNVSIDLVESPSALIVERLREETWDMGIVSDAADTGGLEVYPYRDDPLVLLLPRGHALTGSAAPGLRDAAGHTFVGLSERSALQDLLEREARKLGLRLNVRVRLRSLEAVCRLVAEGAGVAIVPHAVAVRNAAGLDVRSVPLAESWARRRLVVAVRRRAELATHAQRLLAFLTATGSGAQV